MKKIERIFIANRGEIAVRIIKTAREMGISTVVCFIPGDIESLHVKLADKAVALNDNELEKTFLSAEKMISIAVNEGCDSLHPGYGFLSEDYRLAELCEKNKLIYIGPSSKIIKSMGDKPESKRIADSLNIPVLNSLEGASSDILKNSGQIKFPVLVKSAGGGGGKGLHYVESRNKLPEYLEIASREAQNYFGDDRIFIESFVNNARHIEVQLLGDNHGNLVHLYERECSIQRNHQKLIEEAPASSISEELRNKLTDAALKIGGKLNYNNAGTVEFLVDDSENFYFLEMNTRIQVEHGVTEQITGIDLVREQISVASGNNLSIIQKNVKISGHSIEARIYSEDPLNNFRPSSGDISKLIFPKNENIRVETNILDKVKLPETYDPLIAKIISFGGTRPEALKNIKSALKNTIIYGSDTNIPYQLHILNNNKFCDNSINTTFISDNTEVFLEEMKMEKQNCLHNGLISYIAVNFLKNFSDSGSVWHYYGNRRSVKNVTVFNRGNGYKLRWNGDCKELELFIDNNRMLVENVVCNSHEITLIVNGVKYRTFFYSDKNCTQIFTGGYGFQFRSDLILNEAGINKKVNDTSDPENEEIFSPLFGKVLKIHVKPGDSIIKGQSLLIMESMKTENNILCEESAIVKRICIAEGEKVKENQLLFELDYQKNGVAN